VSALRAIALLTQTLLNVGKMLADAGFFKHVAHSLSRKKNAPPRNVARGGRT
jgi:hypothetical protein